MLKPSTRQLLRLHVPRHLAAAGAIIFVLAGLTVVAASTASAAIDPCGSSGNKISCENSKPGTPRSEWDVAGAGDDSIQGFATDISVNVGARIDFKVDTDARSYGITIYRTGYYNGDGARQIATVQPSAALPQRQPECISDLVTELYDCGNWAVSASWNVPSTAVSGVYIAKLRRTDNGDESHITFIVRDDSSHSDVVFQTSDPTWQAYNTYGGSDFYQGAGNGRAYKVSYNRPVLTRNGIGGRDFYFANEYPLVRFMEKNGYDVSYLAGVDTDRRGALLKNHKVFLSVGHDEYWSGAQRTNIEAARDAGVNLQFLSGNEGYWRTRYEPSADSSHTAYRTLVSYKETWANTKIDPSAEWTGTWRDPRFAPRSQGANKPENALTGTMFQANHDDLAVTVSAEEGKLRLWRSTSLASLPASGSATLAPHTVGYESDEDVDNGARPDGLIRLSTTTGTTPEYLTDFGNTVVPGTTTHHLTMYRAPSGALVFGAGSIQWTWGLDPQHDSPVDGEPADPRMQQAQVNLFADMGAQPTTLDASLTKATRTTDTTAPTVAITSPASGASRPNGVVTTLTGTAADVGGRVAGVEISLDGGDSWSAAKGTTNWTYDYVQHGLGSTTVQVRAMDDSANIGTSVSRTLAVVCPCSVFGTAVPKTAAVDDPSAVELGMRFTALANGFVSGVRFYKGAGNTGSHVGSLWSTAGERLAQVNFGNETATGWQQASFVTPVAVTAGQTFVVSYTAPSGHYAADADGFSTEPIDAEPLTVDGGYGAQPAGVYGAAGTPPTQSFQNTNYYVDAVFTTTDTSTLIALNQWPVADSSSVPASTTISAKFSKPVTASSVSLGVVDALGVSVAGSTSYDATSRIVTFTPTSPLDGFVRYTATVDAVDALGQHVTTGKTWSFTTARPPSAPGVCPCTLFNESDVPSVLDSGESSSLELGVRFASSESGSVTGVRFYKGPRNTGTHTGTLWSMDGTVLATGTFTGESVSGWQTLTFARPYEIAANAEYVVSYRAPTGAYSLTPGAFAAANLSRTPLRVAADSGAFTYGSGFPGGRSSSNYFVDPVFERAAPSISVTGRSPADGALDVARATPITISFSSPIATGWTMQVTQGGSAVAGSAVLGGGGTKLTFTPAAALPKDVDVSVDVKGVLGTNGVALPNQHWSFHTTGSDDTSTEQTLMGDEIPAVVAAGDDASPVELGTAFVPQVSGTVTGVRFFKGAGNGGTHTGSLWDASGNRLATVTFTGETASGWQTASFGTPVSVDDGETYVVSYYAPQGHYAYTSGYFDTAKTSGDLVAPATTNGRYIYGGGAPVYSWNATNYFVDPVFRAAPPSVSVVSRAPAPGATDVERGTTASIRFSTAVQPSTAITVLQGTTPIAGSVQLSGDGRTLTFDPTDLLPADADVTVKVSGIATAKGATLPDQTWTFHTEAGETVSLLGDLAPANTSVDDWSAVEVGMAFKTTGAGRVTHLRFYKGPGNAGTHVGSLWDDTGARIATVTFTGETATGWQSAALPAPVALTAGRTYVVSYLAPVGHYAATGGYFAQPRVSGPLTAVTGNNGLYRYGASGGFPTGSWNSTNYFVDVVFRSTQN